MLSIILAIPDEEVRSFVEDIYDRYSKQMYKLAFDIIHNHYDAEDVVHDVILKIINHADYFENSASRDELTKLIVIATRNQAINKYNENKRHDSTIISTSQTNREGEKFEKEIVDSENTDNISLSESNLATLKELIDKLDSKYRDVFVLMGQGFNNKQIAEIMGISVDNVRQRFYRGKMKILQIGGDRLYDN